MYPPSQRDYGHKDSSTPLVPGSLTVFRHFTVDIKRGVIQPMSVQPVNWINYSRQMQMQAKGGDGLFGPYHVKPGPLVAGCNRTYLTAEVPRDHKSPDPRCTCGFYASYETETDFYPTVHWGNAWDRHAYDTPPGRETGFVIVRAAVEMSGTVVMGHRGVRAEKMTIKAIALDTSKWMSPLDAERSARKEWWWYDPTYDLFNGSVAAAERTTTVSKDEAAALQEQGYLEMDYARLQVRRIAERYGVQFFGDNVGRMEQAFPPADVAALGVDTSPPPPREPQQNVISQGQVQLYGRAAKAAHSQQHGKSIIHELIEQVNKAIEADAKRARERQQVQARVAGMMGVRADMVITDEALDVGIDIDGFPKVETKKDKALRLKRERPAPPGTGIDRRRGKLR